MKDELDRLEAALRASRPIPAAGDRARAVVAAMAAFDLRLRGIRRGGRQMHRPIASRLGRFPMFMSRPYPTFAAATVLAIAGGIIFQNWPFRATNVVRPEHWASQMASDESVLRRAETDRTEGVTMSWSEATSAVSDAFRHASRDHFPIFDANPVRIAAEEPVSTFSIDVDTASYSFVRASLNRGVLPPREAVRTEELVNYFPYGYAPPDDRKTPFAVHTSVMPPPWNGDTLLLHIGIKGYRHPPGVRPRANLVFLIDSSGSMEAPDRLPLLKNAFRLLLDTLAPDDRVAIVTYAGGAGTVLPPTEATRRGEVAAALDRLEAGGSTAGAEGIRQAYLLAERNLVEDGVNRVILATDGDFNVGISDPERLEGFIAHRRGGGVHLSVLGFGMGNYNDALMQRLAQSGNGSAAYIDSLPDARKVLVEEAASTLFPIAADVKVQVEFNPAAVAKYRLIGYETRMLRREDFSNDSVDAGEIGAGHKVTALYEVAPAGSAGVLNAPLRYGPPRDGEWRSPDGRIRRRVRHHNHPLQETGRRDRYTDRPARYTDRTVAGTPTAHHRTSASPPPSPRSGRSCGVAATPGTTATAM